MLGLLKPSILDLAKQVLRYNSTMVGVDKTKSIFSSSEIRELLKTGSSTSHVIKCKYTRSFILGSINSK